MAQRYDRILFRAGGQAVIWQSADEGKLIQGVKKVKVLKLKGVREEELEEDNCHYLVTFTLEYRGDTDRRRSNQFQEEFSLDDVRHKLTRKQFKRTVELPQLTPADKSVYDTLVAFYQANDLTNSRGRSGPSEIFFYTVRTDMLYISYDGRVIVRIRPYFQLFLPAFRPRPEKQR
jgi:hypothetical protein